jgi:cyclopropane fatty-acyl-phospholipid synthase-like methyltransferase
MAQRLALLTVVLLTSGCRPAPKPAAALPDAAALRGRVPAPPMSAEAEDWLVRPEREQEEAPEAMLDALGLEPGQTVADVGAGVGYHTLRLARRVGPTGKVYATDLQTQMLARLNENVGGAGFANVTAIHTTDTQTGLPAAAIDLVLMVDVFHELADPEAFLAALKPALKPSGRVALVEFRANDPSVPIKPEHALTVEQVDKELSAAGYHRVGRFDGLPWQHLLLYAL